MYNDILYKKIITHMDNLLSEARNKTRELENSLNDSKKTLQDIKDL